MQKLVYENLEKEVIIRTTIKGTSGTQTFLVDQLCYFYAMKLALCIGRKEINDYLANGRVLTKTFLSLGLHR